MSAIMDATETRLSKQQHSLYIAIVESLLTVTTPEQFLQWTRRELQNLFPHEMFVGGVGHIKIDSIKVQQILCDGFPMDYVRAIQRPDGDVSSPIMARWCKEQKPQLFEAAVEGANYPEPWMAIVQKYDLRNIAAHGMRDLDSNVSTYFNFSRIPGKLTPTHAYLLTLLVPHMHVALVKVLTQIRASDRTAPQGSQHISPREREILKWIQSGKTSGEIAQILNITEKTVRNHVQHALVKLRVKNRAQAVDKAKSLNMLEAK
mgnify:CR=1 FL=1